MIKKGLIAGVVLLAVSFVFNWLSEMLLPGLKAEYQNIAIFRPWSDPLMMVYFFYPFIVGMVFAYLWKLLKFKSPWDLAKFYFLIATIPGMFISYTTFQVSLAMILSWTVMGYIEAVVAGFIFSKLK